MKDTASLSPWQQVAALTVEGLYLLPTLILRGAEWLGVWQLTNPDKTNPLSHTDPMLWLVAGSWLLQTVFLPPLRLGRLAWYQRLETAGGIPPLSMLFTGFRRWGGAIRWRWLLWMRRLMATVVISLPTAIVWGLAHRLTAEGQNTAGLVLSGIGVLLFPLSLAGAFLWCNRYAPAPLLLLFGYPASTAMGVAPHAMAGHGGNYINFWGSHLGKWAACSLLIPLPFFLPTLRLYHIRWLHKRLRESNLSIFHTAIPIGGCILPPTPL